MVARLSPREERKLAKILISSRLKFFAIMQESVLAKVTNSQPGRQLQEFMISPNFIVFEKTEFMISKFLEKTQNFV